jgi:hypothetical protein
MASNDVTTSSSEGTKQAPAAQQNVRRTPTKTSSQSINIIEAHDKYGHIGETALRATLKSLSVTVTGTLKSCEGLALAKAKAKKVPKTTLLKSTAPGERMYTNISGSYKKSLIGSNYWVLFVDQYSSKAWNFFVRRKSMMAKVADKLFTKLKSAGYTLCCNNAGENVTGLSKVCETHGIKEEFTAPHTPQQNGVVERKFVTI